MNAPSPFSPTPFQHARGFSLVEVTLSMGIIASAFLVLLGLMQTGLGVFRSSVDRTLAAQISQRVINEKQQTDFIDLLDTSINPASSLRYYSDEGDELTEAEKAQAIYVARVDITPTTNVPGSGGSNFTNPSLAQVRVRVLLQPGGVTDPKSDPWNNPQLTRSFTSYIPRM